MPALPGTNVYVDGFNLYYGAVKGTPYKWLDIPALCRDLLPRNEICEVHYFTARVKDAPDDRRRSVRQQTFIRALSTRPGFHVHEGRFLAKSRKYPLAPARPFDDPADPMVVCAAAEGPTHAVIVQTEEKGSDVNLASRLLADAFRAHFEVAVVLSNDSDLVEPIRIVTEELGLPVGIVIHGRGTQWSSHRSRRSSERSRHVCCVGISCPKR